MYKVKAGFTGFIFVLLLLFFVNRLDVGATSIKQEKNAVRELKRKKIEEEKRRGKLKSQRASIEKSIQVLDKEAEEIVTRLEELGRDINQNKKKIKKLVGEIDEADKTSQKHYDTMKRRIKYMYENGESSYFDLVLGSKSIEDLLNKAEYMGDIAEYDNNLLDEYLLALQVVKDKKSQKEVELKDLETNRALADNELQKNKAIAADKEIKFKEYNKLIKKSDTVITLFSGEIAEKEAHIDKLIEQEEKRRKEAERQRLLALQKGKSGQASPNVSKFGFAWPIPPYSYIRSGFGYRGEVIKGGGTFHAGIDIPAPIGTKILASLSGTVASAGYHYSMGNYVLLSHDDGYYTVYMHASKLLVGTGDVVSRGQAVALVGSSGFSTGPHLHFGVKVNGVYKNPLNYVSP